MFAFQCEWSDKFNEIDDGLEVKVSGWRFKKSRNVYELQPEKIYALLTNRQCEARKLGQMSHSYFLDVESNFGDEFITHGDVQFVSIFCYIYLCSTRRKIDYTRYIYILYIIFINSRRLFHLRGFITFDPPKIGTFTLSLVNDYWNSSNY